MTQPTITVQEATPTFNLWDEPWIGVILPDGSRQRVGILDCLVNAHQSKALHDQSPLVVAGIHRLLAAILQDIYRPKRVADIASLLKEGRFEPARIDAYAVEYRNRFDIFSTEAPFLQTSDAPLEPAKGDSIKSISSLFLEEPSGTNVIHYRHTYEDEHYLCPACVVGGLLIQPAFASSGGAGIKPSINGVPPIYILPIGPNLFETLTLSMVIPGYQPPAQDIASNFPLWANPITVVGHSEEVARVGYLESLTFAARRMRLHPRQQFGTCTRCAQESRLLISTMVYEMGKSRPKDADLWLDPFAAYRKPGNKDKEPVPVRPQPGKSLWREYSTLFLSSTTDTPDVMSPNIVKQLSDLADNAESISEEGLFHFRCIGIRTDMKAKIFEWIDETLDLPTGLLREPRSAREVRRGIERAEQCEHDIVSIFRHHFRPEQQGKRERFQILRERMSANYWSNLSFAFREFILSTDDITHLEETVEQWINSIITIAGRSFEETVEEVGDRGSDLRKRVQALQACRIRLATRRKEWTNGDTGTTGN